MWAYIITFSYIQSKIITITTLNIFEIKKKRVHLEILKSCTPSNLEKTV